MKKSILFALIAMVSLLMGSNSVFAKSDSSLASQQQLVSTAILHAEMAIASAEQGDADEAGQHARVAYGASKEIISTGLGSGATLSRAQSHIREATLSAKHGKTEDVIKHAKTAIEGWKKIKF